MFVITQSKTYKHEVKFNIPSEDGKSENIQSFTAIFHRLGLDEITEAMNSKDDVTLARKVLAGWEDVRDGGEPLEFNEDNFSKALKVVGFASAVGRGFINSIGGVLEKN